MTVTRAAQSTATTPATTRSSVVLSVLLIAMSGAIGGGLAEAMVYWCRSVVPDWLGWRNDLLPQILWIAPVSNLLLFLVIALPVSVFAGVLPRGRADVLAYAIFGWLAIYAPMAATQKLHPAAALLIATGFTVQLCRYMRGRPAVTTASLLRRFGVVSLAVVIACLIGVATVRQHPVTDPAQAVVDRAQRPNLLLITLDTLRADHVSAYGYQRPTTPTFDRLAGEGVLFENAFSTASWTLPSHASMMTGRYSYEHRADGRPLDERYPTLAGALSARGYTTAAFVANTHYLTPGTGLERGFSHFEAYYSSPTDMFRRTVYGKLVLDRLPLLGYYDIPGRKRARRVNAELLRWLRARPRAPFFVFLNYFDVHDPYVPPRGYETHFSRRPNRGSRINSEMIPDLFRPAKGASLNLSAEDLQLEIDGYDASLAYLDAQLGELFAQLADLRLLDNTVIIIASDHGESFGEHGLYGHGNSLYRNLIHVPLIIRFPGHIPAGRRIRAAVSLQAIPATVMSLLGFDSDVAFPGQSLSRYWSGTAALAETDESVPAFSEALPEILPGPKRGAMKSLSSWQWHLVVQANGQVELFRIDRDGGELHDIATTPEGAETVQQLGAQLAPFMAPGEWKTFADVVARQKTP